ncbi:hypothetical protein [Burkholderia cenocepacia]|uniref:hypothetical protein n=1 Tax=Burkholderia cenocepacia TaxID=95486 RepID=UPI0011780783|nr:hypothetical protein [Burkholderia cenocepacia]
MKIDKEAKQERSKAIQSGIRHLLTKGDFSVVALAKEVGMGVSTLYLHPQVRKLIRPELPTTVNGITTTNRNYRQILQAGFDIRTSFNGTNVFITLAKNNEVIYQTSFPANGRNSEAVKKYLPHARHFSVPDKSLIRALKYIQRRKA